MSYGTNIVPDIIRETQFAAITTGFLPIGTPLVNQARQLIFQNLTDAHIYVSWDGVNDHLKFPPNGFFVDDVTTNRANDEGAFTAIGTQFYIKYDNTIPFVAPTVGSFCISVFSAFKGG